MMAKKIRYKGVYYERYYFSRRFRHTPVLRYSGKIAFMINIKGSIGVQGVQTR